MRFGVCAPLEQLPMLAQTGYDYIEPPLSPTLAPERAEAEVMPALIALTAMATLRAETWNLFLPGDMKVVGREADAARQERYLEAAFQRASALGGRLVVFGSGGARGVPEGVPMATAHQQLVEFSGRAGEAAARHGMEVAIEPLNRGECNIINSVGEGLVLARAVSHPAVGVLSDLYHVAVEGQSYDETREAGALLTHVHVAGAVGRRAPVRADISLLTGYFRALKEGGYDGRVSVEGHWDDPAAQYGETLAVLREAWEAA